MTQLTENEKHMRKVKIAVGTVLVLPIAAGVCEAILESNGVNTGQIEDIAINFGSLSPVTVMGSSIGGYAFTRPIGPGGDYNKSIARQLTGFAIGGIAGISAGYLLKTGAKAITKLFL